MAEKTVIWQLCEKALCTGLLVWGVTSYRDSSRAWRYVQIAAMVVGSFGICEGYLWLIR